MKRTIVGRLLGFTLAVVMGISSPVSAFAQEEVGELLAVSEETEEVEDAAEDVTSAEEEETEASAEAESAQEEASVEEEEILSEDEKESAKEDIVDEAVEEEESAEEAEDTEAEDTEDEQPAEEVMEETADAASLLGTGDEEEFTIPVEFINFGSEFDAAVAENGYYVTTYEITDAKEDGTYDSKDNFNLWVSAYVDFVPHMENGVLSAIVTNEGREFTSFKLDRPSWFYAFTIKVEVSKEFVESGEPLRLTAKWGMEELSDRLILDANGGVFDDSFYGDSKITYTLGSHGIVPVDGAKTREVTVTYSEDRTKAYVPVMKNGFFPIYLDSTGVSVDLGDRPYDGQFPIMGWNTEKDGSGQSYFGDEYYVIDEDQREDVTHKKSLTLYAIYPDYYAADFILDGESFFGDCWLYLQPGDSWTLGEMFTTTAAIHGEDKFEKEGYKLSWYLDENFAAPASFSQRVDSCEKKSEALKVYGKWTAIPGYRKIETGTVRFANIDGAVPAAKSRAYDAETGISLEVGKTLDLSKYLFTKKGYTFKNWTAEVNGTTKTFARNAKISKLFKNEGEEFTLTANWTPVNYKITYKLNEGVQGKNAPKSYNIETATELLKPTRTGYVFRGWDIKRDGKAVTEAELAEIYDAENNRLRTGVYGNLTLTARFAPFEYKILFHVNVDGEDKQYYLTDYGDEYGPLLYTDKVRFDDAARTLSNTVWPNPSKRGDPDPNHGIEITGFSRTEGGKADFVRSKTYTKLTSTEEILNLYAVVEENTYDINYSLYWPYEEATLSKPLYTYKGGNKRIALPTAKCPGYKFYGWYYYDGEESLYDRVRKYTPYGYEEFATHIVANANEDIYLSPCFIPNKIRIYVSPNGSGVYEDTTWDTVYGSVDVRLKVTKKRAYADVYYNGEFESDWRNDSFESWYRPGYELVGYSTNPKAKSESELIKLDDDSLNTLATSGSATVYCIWKPINWCLTFSDAVLIDGREVIDYYYDNYNAPEYPEYFTYGKGFTLKKATLEGYDFLGWIFPDEAYVDEYTKVTVKSGYVTGVKAKNCNDITLCPVFRKCRYELGFNANGGTFGKKKSGVIMKNVDYSEDVSSLVSALNKDNVTRKGYQLVGFALDSKGRQMVLDADGKSIYKNRRIVLYGKGKVTLYAIWRKN